MLTNPEVLDVVDMPLVEGGVSTTKDAVSPELAGILCSCAPPRKAKGQGR